MFVFRRLPIARALWITKNSTVSSGVRAARTLAAIQTPSSLLDEEIFNPSVETLSKAPIEPPLKLSDRLEELESTLVLPHLGDEDVIVESAVKVPKKRTSSSSSAGVKRITTHFSSSEQLDARIAECLGCEGIQQKETVYCVMNPGRSLLPDALIEQGAKRLIVLEGSPLFTDVWKLKCQSLRSHSSCDVEFHAMNFDRLASIAVSDFHRKFDSLAPVFNSVPHVSWETSDAPMCFVGTVKPSSEKSLLLHLLCTRCFKSSIWRWGPCELLLFVSATKAAVLLNNNGTESFPKTAKNNKHTMLRHNLYQMLFDIEKVLEEPKTCFEPTITTRKGLESLVEQQKLDLSNMYLLRIKPKRTLPDGLDEECLLQHWFFHKQIAFNKGATKVLEFIENWFPHCSERLKGFEIAEGSDIDENLQLKELSFGEATRIFAEIRQWDEYESSTFMAEADRFAENTVTMSQVVKGDPYGCC